MSFTKFFLITFFLILLSPFFVQAVSRQGLTISPLIIEEMLSPGESLKGKLKIYSQSDEPIYVRFTAQDFKARGEEGEQIFIEPEEIHYTWSLASWIKLPEESIFLKPGHQHRREIEYTIEVPEKAEPGGYYAAIFASPDVEKIRHGTTTVGKVGTLVLLTVGGRIVKEGVIEEFATFKKVKEPNQVKEKIVRTNFFTYPPVNFLVRFKNTGNVHLKPQGKIEIFNIFQKKIAEIPVNERGKNALPGAIRRYDEVWGGGWPYEKLTLGKFRARLSLSYDEISPLYSSLSFWVLPGKEMLFILGGLILGLILLFISIRRYNRWVLARAGRKDEIERLKAELAQLKGKAVKQQSYEETELRKEEKDREKEEAKKRREEEWEIRRKEREEEKERERREKELRKEAKRLEAEKKRLKRLELIKKIDSFLVGFLISFSGLLFLGGIFYYLIIFHLENFIQAFNQIQRIINVSKTNQDSVFSDNFVSSKGRKPLQEKRGWYYRDEIPTTLAQSVFITETPENLKPVVQEESLTQSALGQNSLRQSSGPSTGSGAIFSTSSGRSFPKSEERINKSEIIIKILNGNGYWYAARSQREHLVKQGFESKNLSVADASSYGYLHTLIQYEPGKEAEARIVKEALRHSEEAELEEVRNLEVDVLVILGRDNPPE
jgi:hypothetical protein